MLKGADVRGSEHISIVHYNLRQVLFRFPNFLLASRRTTKLPVCVNVTLALHVLVQEFTAQFAKNVRSQDT